jgi:hypothetical protein
MEDSEEAKIKSPPKKKWWPVLASKRSSRFQGNATIMEKAEAYLMKKNLEISRTFKGNSFATLSHEYLFAVADVVRADIGNDNQDRNAVIQAFVDQELSNCYDFASDNP